MDGTSTPGERPTFLTVLCILSFIGGLWGAYSGFSSAFTDQPQRDLEEARAQIEETRATMGDQGGLAERMMEEGIAAAEQGVEKARPLGIASLVLSLVGLFGVWQMWNLKKMGFGVYTASSVVGLLVPMFILDFSMVTLLGLGFGGLISVVFIILYAVNLKHMH